AAKEAAIQSMVLLKNNKNVLPMSTTKKVALIGPLANAPREQLGTWTFDGEKEHSVTPLTSFTEVLGNSLRFSEGLSYSREKRRDGFKAAVRAARKSDIVVFVGGEEAILSGEAHSRADISLPGYQEELIHEISKTGKPIVLVVMAGRPLTLGNIIDKVDAVLYAWHPGTMAGPALADLIFGVRSPAGRLPVTWPKSVGQIPVYYNHKNTGRPASADSYVHIDDIPIGAWQSSLGNNSHYLDDGYTPMYPFGYGLTYSSFSYEDLKQSANSIKLGGEMNLSATITNTGKKTATEVVQLYVQDEFGSITRPVKELLRFERVTLEPGQSKEVSFNFSTEDLQFYDSEGQWVTEPGTFKCWIGGDAASGLQGSFAID
ncbi:MAG: glycoside hydrolase family 3 C-terminal domain-containing protein, partial [Bacteroidota bacterium]